MKFAINIRGALFFVCLVDARCRWTLLKTSCLSVVNDRGCLTTF